MGFTVGAKAGLLPPIMSALEVGMRVPHILVSAFGVYAPGHIGAFEGSDQALVGIGVGLETQRGPRENTFHTTFTLAHARSWPDYPGGVYETSTFATVTLGYVWKWTHFEWQLGAGGLFIISDEVHNVRPCRFFCGSDTPPLIPTLEVGLRWGF